jgi:lipoprotein-releasing system ATP-binding protein
MNKGAMSKTSNTSVILDVKDLCKSYKSGADQLDILKDMNFQIVKGETVALVGPSGAGKSTLLSQIGLLDTADSGQVIVGGEDATKLSDRAKTKLRSSEIGFVYQFHHLLPEFSALENVMLPQIIAGQSKSQAKERAQRYLDRLGLKDRYSHRPATLSGGEQQRVAIARALANKPSLLLADEPTGNLDPQTGQQVFKLLTSIARKTGVSALIATHNMDLAAKMDRILVLQDGKVTVKKGEAKRASTN